MSLPSTEPPLEATVLPPHPAWDRPWALLVLLFLVMGALGLPLLWWSRSFSRWNKLWLSLAVTIYTGLLVALAGWSVSLALTSIRAALQ